MHFTTKILRGVLVIIATLAISGSSFAEEIATITTEDSEVFEDVTYTVNQLYKVITIKLATGEKNISFANIRSIVDAQGNDITAESLGRVYKGREETWLDKDSEIIRRAERKLWRVGLQIGSNYSFPVGDYYEGFDAGVGFGGRIKVPITYRLALRLQVSKSGMKVDESECYCYSIDSNLSVVNQKFSVSAIRYVLEVEYFGRPDRDTPGKTIWYTYTGLGVISHKLSLDLRVRDNTDGQTFDLNDSSTETKFIQTLGGGMVQLLSGQVGLDFGVNMDLVYIGSGDDYSPVNAFIFDLRVGLIYLIK